MTDSVERTVVAAVAIQFVISLAPTVLPFLVSGLVRVVLVGALVAVAGELHTSVTDLSMAADDRAPITQEIVETVDEAASIGEATATEAETVAEQTASLSAEATDLTDLLSRFRPPDACPARRGHRRCVPARRRLTAGQSGARGSCSSTPGPPLTPAKTNRVPVDASCPTAASTSTVQPWDSAMVSTMERPSPVPASVVV